MLGGADRGWGRLTRERSERVVNALVVGGATFAAIEVLIKFSAGPVIAAFFLIALVGLRARWWQVGGYLALLAAEGARWLFTGQSLSRSPASSATPTRSSLRLQRRDDHTPPTFPAGR